MSIVNASGLELCPRDIDEVVSPDQYLIREHFSQVGRYYSVGERFQRWYTTTFGFLASPQVISNTYSEAPAERVSPEAFGLELVNRTALGVDVYPGTASFRPVNTKALRVGSFMTAMDTEGNGIWPKVNGFKENGVMHEYMKDVLGYLQDYNHLGVTDIVGGSYAEALFDTQVETYARLGFTAFTGDEVFNELRAKVLEAVGESTVPSFFSLAIPDVSIPLNKQLELAGSRAFLQSQNMKHAEHWEQEPFLPYALLDVEIGEDYRGVPAETAAEYILARDRHGFRIDELISLSLHKPELWAPPHRGLYAATLHPEPGQLPATIDLYRYGDGGLKVKRDPGTISDSDWTTPSYHDRVIVG